MSIELLLIIFTITYCAAVLFAYWAGWRARDRQQPPGGSYGLPRRYRSGTNPPQQAFTEGRTIRGNGNGRPTTPKPPFPSARIICPDGETIGHRSISSPRKP